MKNTEVTTPIVPMTHIIESQIPDGYTLVNVRAQQRPGLSGFYRCNRFWSDSADGTNALATADALRVLRAESMMFTQTIAPEGLDLEKLPRVDAYKVPHSNDVRSKLETRDKLQRELDAEKATLEVELIKAELAEIRRKRAETAKQVKP